MAGSKSQIPGDGNPVLGIEQSEKTKSIGTLLTSLWRYAIAGGSAVLLLNIIELADVNILRPAAFETFTGRLIFSSYYSLSLLSGLMIGLLTGVFIQIASLLVEAGSRLLAKLTRGQLLHRPVAGLAVAALAAFLLNQHLRVHAYIIALIREAEKFDSLRTTLLNHERATSYLILMGLVVSLWTVWRIARDSGSMNPFLRTGWLACLIILIAAAYYVDSRIEVDLYEYSLHRSMFLLNLTLAMALVVTAYNSSAGIRSFLQELNPLSRKTIKAGAAIVLVAAAAFTFVRFEKDQNLKTLLLYRTAQARQHFKLFRWALDFDRDGYSPYLGGGDLDDGNGSINPGEIERVGDGIDNNCIGGDLTEQAIVDWKAGFTRLRSPATAQAKRYNVVFVFIDALRPDHMSAYGYDRKTSPNIDRLAARSSVFEKAYAPAPDTYGSVPRFMQSNYWDGHIETWTEVLTRNGYNSLYFPRRTPFMLRHVKGVKVVEQGSEETWKDTIDAAIDVLGNLPSDSPFCAYLYSFDPHLPYLRHEEFDFGSSLIDRYDSEIAYTDFHLGRLFDWMDKEGRLDDTMIVIVSDHGESLGERGIYRHSSQLYDEQLRIPILVYVPGSTPNRVSVYVSSIDLGSTILDAVGLGYPDEYLGVSLLPLMRGEPFVHPPVFAEQISKEASPYVRLEQNVNPERKKYMVVTQDGYKLIYNRNFYGFELFNLNDDPAETRNLYDHIPQKAEEMKSLLGRFIDVELVSRPWDADDNKHSRGRERKKKRRSR